MSVVRAAGPRCLLPAVLVAALTAACFAPALRNELVGWDDTLNLSENPHYRGFSPAHLRWMFTTVHGGHYQPLTWLTLAVDHALWGSDPTGYHLTSLLLHAANAALVYVLAAALLRRAGMAAGSGATLGAAAAALFWALHPLRVESVAWASERRDVLSVFFYLLAVVAYCRRHEGGGTGWLALSLASLACSLLSKAWGMTLPVVLLVLDAYPLGRLGAPDTRRAALRGKVPYVLLAAAGAGMAFVAQRPVEAMRTLAEHGIPERTAQAAYGLCFYLAKTVVPLALSPLYLLDLDLDPTRPRYVLALAAVVGLTVALVAARRRWPWALAAWVAYVAIVSPVLGFVQTGPQLVADRYSYLATVPWAVVVGAVVARAWTTASRRVVTAAVAVVCAGLAVLTVRQIAVWHDSDALWAHVLRLDPESYVAYTNRGTLRLARGDRTGALADYTRALEIHAGYPLAWFNRGNIRRALGDVDGAIADLTRAIQLAPQDPKNWNNRGWNREAKGDLRGALEDYQQALRVAPPYFEGRAMIEKNIAEVRQMVGGS